MRFCVILAVLFLPVYAHAAVVINEIAWMGSAESPNDEWIELYNSGQDPVSLDGWSVKDGGSLSIPLSGSIGAGAYAVLERTDDGSAPGTAFLIYTGALSNTGATLSLYRQDNTLEDQVSGGENWESVGGDNITKETAQRTSQGWQTAHATPGLANAAHTGDEDEEDNEESEETATETTTPKKDKDPVSIELSLPDLMLTLAMLSPDVVFVNQKVLFDAAPSGLGKTALDSLQYTWNFGDANTKQGKRVTHAYTYPGDYVVTLHALFGHREQVARKTVTVLPATFTVTRNSEGDVLIQNNAKYEVNISGFTIKGGHTKTFPERSIIVGNGTITLPKEEIGVSASAAVTLHDNAGKLLASSFEAMSIFEALSIPQVAYAETAIESAQDEPDPGNFSFAGEVKEEDAEDKEETALRGEEKDEPVRGSSGETLPLLGLAGIVTLGIIAVLFGRKKGD